MYDSHLADVVGKLNCNVVQALVAWMTAQMDQYKSVFPMPCDSVMSR